MADVHVLHARVDWRWHKLFLIVGLGMRDTKEAKRAAARLLRAKMRTDKQLEQKELEHAQD